MITFQVDDMTCGHCVKAITEAVKAADGNATVSVDLATKRVEIGSAVAGKHAFKAAIQEAGYAVVEAAPPTGPATASKSGSCCGCH